jgi:hypothetical protein
MRIPQPEHLEVRNKHKETDDSKLLAYITQKMWLTQADGRAMMSGRINTLSGISRISFFNLTDRRRVGKEEATSALIVIFQFLTVVAI